MRRRRLREDTTLKGYITFEEVGHILPTHPAATTCWRWARRGLAARDGSRVHLRHVRIGRRLFTREEWVREFTEELVERDLAALERVPTSASASVSVPEPDQGRAAFQAALRTSC